METFSSNDCFMRSAGYGTFADAHAPEDHQVQTPKHYRRTGDRRYVVPSQKTAVISTQRREQNHKVADAPDPGADPVASG
jgi:hypothetical protein